MGASSRVGGQTEKKVFEINPLNQEHTSAASVRPVNNMFPSSETGINDFFLLKQVADFG
jgi:hypothetical protein